MYFFETVVRIHRVGEGASYTGLKPEGTDVGPVVPAADKALEDGTIDAFLKFITDAAMEGILERFEDIMAKKNFKVDDVEVGREYVKSYVEFLHYVEAFHEAIEKSNEDTTYGTK
jgi:hypothetical protein